MRAGVKAWAGAAGAGFSGAALVDTIVHQSFSECKTSVVVNLHNSSSWMLVNPQVYTCSGCCYTPPHPRVESGKTDACSFGQTRGTSCDSAGVMTYDITKDLKEKAVKRLAIMFSVPYEHTYSERLWDGSGMALGLFDIEQACDEYLYSLMRTDYYEGSSRGGKACGSEISFRSGRFTLAGTMSAVSKAECKVLFYEH